MKLCEKLITADVEVNCESPIREGLQSTAYIINKSQISSVTQSGNIVSAITLERGMKAYKIQVMGRQPFNGTSVEMQVNDLMNNFNKVFAFSILDNSPDVSELIVNPLANGEFVVIFENKYNIEDKKNGFEVVGLETGAVATSIQQNKYENQSAYMCELTESNAPSPNIFFWTNDYATTKAALEALTETAS